MKLEVFLKYMILNKLGKMCEIYTYMYYKTNIYN